MDQRKHYFMSICFLIITIILVCVPNHSSEADTVNQLYSNQQEQALCIGSWGMSWSLVMVQGRGSAKIIIGRPQSHCDWLGSFWGWSTPTKQCLIIHFWLLQALEGVHGGSGCKWKSSPCWSQPWWLGNISSHAAFSTPNFCGCFCHCLDAWP